MSNLFKNFNPLKTGIIGSLVAALCCFTPILVILLGLTAYGYYRQSKAHGFTKVSNFAIWLCLADRKSLFLPILSQ